MLALLQNRGCAVFADRLRVTLLSPRALYGHPPRQVCFMLEMTDVTPTSMYIHNGPAGNNGYIEIVFSQVASGGFSGCADSSKSTIAAILNVPTMYYLNLNSAEFPGGAIRGQLEAPASMMVMLGGSQVPEGAGSPTGYGPIELMNYNTKVRIDL